LRGIEVKDPFGLLVVIHWHGTAGKIEDIPYPSGICQKKLSLESQAVMVAAGHLRNGLTTLLLNSEAAALFDW